MFIAFVFAVVGYVDRPEYHDDMSSKSITYVKPLSDQEKRLATFYASQGSPEPALMAQATAKTKRPRLMAAVAAVESNGNPHAIGKIGEVTAWQLREELHGTAGNTVDDHARKAEQILEQLLKESDGNFRRALSAYNGDRTGRYAAKVLRKLKEVPA
jgi:hypothetical protein